MHSDRTLGITGDDGVTAFNRRPRRCRSADYYRSAYACSYVYYSYGTPSVRVCIGFPRRVRHYRTHYYRIAATTVYSASPFHPLRPGRALAITTILSVLYFTHLNYYIILYHTLYYTRLVSHVFPYYYYYY